MMENQDRHHGSLIAFEGPENLISTQLRLLPASPQLLVLPSLQHYMKEKPSTHFSPRSYIKDVHRAALARREAALRFLNESTNDNKRVVFVNGGTAGAVSQCISTISARQASGDATLAEAIYRNVAREGVRGLDEDDKYAHEEASDRQMMASERGADEVWWEDTHEDPNTRAMRAADALYKETDSLQSIDCYIRTRPRSLSMPGLSYTDGLGQASPYFVFGSAPSEGGSVFEEDDEEPYTTAEEDNSNGARTCKTLQDNFKLSISVPPRPFGGFAETTRTRSTWHRSTAQLVSPTANSSMSPPITPEGVVYGEARLVQMAASKSQVKQRRSRSLDDTELNEARRRRISVQLAPATKRVMDQNSTEAKSRHLSIVEDLYSADNLMHLPQAMFVKAQTTTIRRSPTFRNLVSKPARDTYVHHGTDVAEFGNDKAELEDAFEPVLPLHEDVIIQFTSFGRDYILDSVIESLKDGSYPMSSHCADSSDSADTESCPSTPETADLFDLERGFDGLSPVAEVPSADEASDYDPYAPRGSNVLLASNVHPGPPPQRPQQLPTPALTPTPHVEAKFHDLPIVGRQNAMVTQNAVRKVLESYYPPQDGTGYSRFSSSFLPDMNKLWRPIFRVAGNSVQSTADLILAMGCQRGVESEFVAALTGQVERLGWKTDGMTRSGRLDIRYLIALALQSSSTQPLTSLPANVLSNSPHFLACLLVPHLETYLATNTDTRFLLLSYPAEHLATVLALQKLIGADLFKIAGVLDTSDISASPRRPSSTGDTPLSVTTAMQLADRPHAETDRIAAPSTTTTTDPAAPSAEPRPMLASRRRISFSRADYVLPSSATEAEIAAFLSTLWKVLIDIDAFYTPPTRRTSRQAPASLVSKFNFPGTPSTPPLSPASPRTTLAALNLAPRGGERMSPMQSPRRGGHIAGALPSPLLRRGGALGAGSGDGDSAVSMVDEGDFYDDDEERRLMPMYMRNSELRKGNSRKALKWLGLA